MIITSKPQEQFWRLLPDQTITILNSTWWVRHCQHLQEIQQAALVTTATAMAAAILQLQRIPILMLELELGHLGILSPHLPQSMIWLTVGKMVVETSPIDLLLELKLKSYFLSVVKQRARYEVH
ncbi:hypothetical protein C8J56DRAFT_1045651 [Mycena floridula]|nr:hypothetical protein C8J56DRAFT_1045651 [Mycena floridula]